MLKRDKSDLPIVWVHVDMSQPGIGFLIGSCRAKHEANTDWKLSVNVSRDGTEALVKVAGASKAWAAGLGDDPLVKAVFDDTDHDKAVALVTTPEWLTLLELEDGA